MIIDNIKKINSPKGIVEYARESGMINMAENYSCQPNNLDLENLLQNHILPSANTFSPKYGLLQLREAISKKTAHFYDYTYNPESDITITSGVKQSVFAAILAFLKDGDEVVVFEPSRRSYESIIDITGATAVYVGLKSPEYLVVWEDVQKVITSKTRMIIINSPHFPTGSTLSELDMLRLQKIINGTNIIILSDESFEHIIFDNEMHQSISLYPKLRERSVIVSSFDESLNIPSWHIGYCLSVPKLMHEIRKVIDVMGVGIMLPYQKVVAEYMSNHNSYNSLSLFYQRKRDLFFKVLEDSKIKITPSKGTYFQLINLEEISEDTDTEMGHRLMRECNLAAVPISYYYHQKSKRKFLRLNLSLPDEVLLDVATQLKNM